MEEEGVRGFMFELSGEWAPLVLKLLVVRNPICEPQMRSTTKKKLIVEKSSLQKVYFFI